MHPCMRAVRWNMIIAFCLSMTLFASGRYGTQGDDSVPLTSLSLLIMRPTKEASLSDRSLAQWPNLDDISNRNWATVSASLCFTALSSTSFRKLSIAAKMYWFPCLSGLLNKIIRYFKERSRDNE